MTGRGSGRHDAGTADEAAEAGFAADLEAAVKLLEAGKKAARHSRGKG